MRTVLTAKDIGFELKRIVDLHQCICGKSGEKKPHNSEINPPRVGDDLL